ncbi:PadR family transcriptional regulator [Fontibacillus phaseoli]|uniref:PadR family transcriptional regulator n=1 Tax=Fontibacillus phaseoli TaxID=1416533 RepID=A0A369BLQ1_9BACL|nr:PadR family transcriptional regulator [Fontibacillus phaseoli]RCX22522.1 PadR family transcriptional regulator [Fontibacillus phaseoli]
MTNVMVLGLLLKYGPMSGYEIQQKMQSAKTDKWAYVQPASIYHALRKLDKDELVSLQSLEQTGNRSKAIYSVTSKGKHEFDRMLVDSFKKTSVVFPTPLYTVLTFIDEAPKENIIQALEVQQQAIRNIYDEMKAGQKEKEAYSEIPKNVLMIFENIYDQCEIQLQFIERLKQDLLSELSSPDSDS